MTRDEALKRAWQLAGLAERAVAYVTDDGARATAAAQVAMVYVSLADSLTFVPLPPAEGAQEWMWEAQGEPAIGRVPPLDTAACEWCGAAIMNMAGQWRHVVTGEPTCHAGGDRLASPVVAQ